MTDTKLKVTARGLSANGQTLFELLFAGKQVFPEQEWVFGADWDVMDVDAVIIDVDSSDGASLWTAFGQESGLPVKVLYSADQQPSETAKFSLKKPCRSFQLAELMKSVASEVQGTHHRGAPPRLAESNDMTGKSDEKAHRPEVNQAREESAQITPAATLAGGLSRTDQFRLKRWPNFGRLAYTPRHVKLAVLMSRQTSHLERLAAESGLALNETIGFINTCYAMGYLQVVKGVTQVDRAPPARSPAGGASGKPNVDVERAEKTSFLQRIRKRLGL